MAEYLLVDGYNIIFAWPELNEFAEHGNLDAARMKLMELLSDYQGYYQNRVILVFDGYKVKNNPGTVEKYHNIYVVYTKEAETADQYIEKTNGSLAKSNQVRVATSDHLEQVIILGQGATRVSARDLQKEMEEMRREIRKDYLHPPKMKRNSFIDNLDPEIAAMLEVMRLTEDPKDPHEKAIGQKKNGGGSKTAGNKKKAAHKTPNSANQEKNLKENRDYLQPETKKERKQRIASEKQEEKAIRDELERLRRQPSSSKTVHTLHFPESWKNSGKKRSNSKRRGK